METKLRSTGSTQLLCETYMTCKPPMSTIIAEGWTAKITDTTVFTGKVVVKGQVEHTFQYLHPHGKKASNEQEENNRESESSDAEKTDTLNVLEGGLVELLDVSSGIIHFHQQVFEFTGTVTMDVQEGAAVTGVATVKEYDAFEATETEDTGLISGGEQTFKIDITLSTVA